MNEVMFVTGGELLQFLPISSKKRVGMSTGHRTKRIKRYIE